MGLPVMPIVLHRPLRLLLAVTGIGVAVLLMFVQLGFLNGVADSQANVASYLDGDLVLVHDNRTHLDKWDRLDPARMRQVVALDGVDELVPVYKGSAQWRVAAGGELRRIIVYAYRPGSGALRVPADAEAKLKVPGRLLFDARSRAIFGSVAPGQQVELDDRHYSVAGLVRIGPNLVNDGQVIMSEGDWLQRRPGQPPMMAVIRLRADADPVAVAQRIDTLLAGAGRVYSPAALFGREVDYTMRVAPVGLLFGFGLLVCLLIGSLICYQIQYAEIQETAAALATLRALGFSDLQVTMLAVRQALLYTLGGFLVALWPAFLVYARIAEETRLVMLLTPQRLGLILSLVVLMGLLAGLLAARRVLRLDPADLY